MTTPPERSAWDQVAVALGGDRRAAGGGAVPAGWDKLRDALTGSGPSRATQEPTIDDPADDTPAVPAGWAQLRDALGGPSTQTSVLDPPVGAAVAAPGVPDIAETAPGRGRREGPSGLAARAWGTKRGKAAAAVVAAAAVAVSVILGTSGGGGLPSNAAFSVNGKVVNIADFNNELTVRQTLYAITPPATSDTAKYHTYLTSAAQAEAVSVLLDQLAPRQGVTVSNQTAQSSLNQAISQQYGGDQSKFAQALGAAGLNQAQVLTEVNHNLVYQKLFAKIVGTPTVTTAQIQQYFDQHRSQLAVPETRQISHIVVSTQASAQSIMTQLQSGAPFATLAAQSLDAATKANGGQLGNYSKADLQPAFANAAFAAQPNVPFGPVQDPTGGFDVGVVTAVHPARATVLDSTTSAAIKTVLMDQAQANAWDGWLGGQIKNARITYAAKYRPSNPNQPPQIPVPRLTGETLAGVGPAQASAPTGSGSTGSTSAGG